MQCVVDSGSGSTDPVFVQRRPELVNGGVVGMAQEVVEEGDSLWRAAQPGSAQGFIDVVGCYLNRHQTQIRLNSNEVQGRGWSRREDFVRIRSHCRRTVLPGLPGLREFLNKYTFLRKAPLILPCQNLVRKIAQRIVSDGFITFRT
jgi:hypothetical protein